MKKQSQVRQHNRLGDYLSNKYSSWVTGNALLNTAIVLGNPVITWQLIKMGARLSPPSILSQTTKLTGSEWHQYRHNTILSGWKHWACLSIIYKSDLSFRKHCFFQSVVSSDSNWLTNILQAGQDINTLHSLGMTALSIARKQKMHKMVSILRKNGARDLFY